MWEARGKGTRENPGTRNGIAQDSEEDIILLKVTVLNIYCPLPHKLLTHHCSVWEIAILGQGKMEKNCSFCTCGCTTTIAGVFISFSECHRRTLAFLHQGQVFLLGSITGRVFFGNVCEYPHIYTQGVL